MALSVINRAPGVYIEEIAVAGPIAGVATSTAAFIGPARSGPLKTPKFLTNWTQFVNAFGVQDKAGPYIAALPVYVTHAVRGFFDNGGSSCYFVRVGTAVRSTLPLDDRAAAPRHTLVVTAKEEGVTGDAITVAVEDANIVAAVAAVKAEAALTTAANGEATVPAATDAAKFRPGDTVLLEQDANSERAVIAAISGTTIKFQSNLNNAYTGGTIRIADLIPGQTKFRLADTTGLEASSCVSITQDGTTEARVVQAVEAINKFITLEQGLTNSYTLADANPAVTLQTLEFALTIAKPGADAENFPNLSMDPRHSRYWGRIVDSKHVDVTAAEQPNPSSPPNNRPTVLATTPLRDGQEDNPTQLQATHYREGIDTLERVDDVNILCIPDRTDLDVQAGMIVHCEKMKDRFAILDPLRGATPSNGIVTQRQQVSSDGGYAALYYPRIVITDPLTGGRLTVPPSGHIAGVYARVDGSRGVHKAPANETLRGALDLERTLTDDEQGPLNEQGVNVIRAFPGSGIRIWGARTIAPENRTQWRYINVRRLLLFIEESLQEGTQFAVFEPNDTMLWGKLKRQITGFLTRVWRDGALFGDTAEQAFRVRIDEELNPGDVRALGQLIIEVIVQPTTPAEFIVFRIISDPTGKSLIQE